MLILFSKVATSSHSSGFSLKTQNNQELFKHFDGHVVCGDDEAVKRGKPEPDIFHEAARRFFNHSLVDPSDILVFEDSPSGVLAAIKGGMQCVWVPDVNLEVDPDLAKQCLKVVRSLEDFSPSDFIL